MRRWGVNPNQAIHALNKIAYELERGKVPETARVIQDIEAAIIAANACIDAVDEAQKLFESFKGHPIWLGEGGWMSNAKGFGKRRMMNY